MNDPALVQDIEAASLAEMGNKLAFSKKLQAVANKIHAAHNIDEIILEVSEDICSIFEAENLTIYVTTEDNSSIVSKVKIGLNEFKELKLPINFQSMAGYAASHKIILNIADVYNDAELQKISPKLRFLKEVDKKTGFHTKQMLVFPILNLQDDSLMGVVQVINTLSGLPFPSIREEGAQELGKTLAIAFNNRRLSPEVVNQPKVAPNLVEQREVQLDVVKAKFDMLVTEGIISGAELELAQRSARKKNKGLEEVLMEEFQIIGADIGKSLSAFFAVPLENYKADRIKPMDLLKKLKHDYVLANGWMPIDESKDEGLIILTPDPEKVKSSRIVNNIFPRHARISYKVCLRRDFYKTVELFYGVRHVG